MLFPLVVNHEEEHTLLKLAHHFAALGFVSGFEINSHVVRTFAISDWNEDILVHRATLLIYVLDDRVCYFLQGIHAAFEGLHCLLSQFICQHILFSSAELLLGEWHFHSKDLHHIHLQSFVVHYLAGICHYGSRSVINHIGDIHTDTLTHQRVVAFRVDDITLLVHHIIVLDEAFTNTKVILLHLLLCTFDGVGDHLMLNHLALLEAHAIHQSSQTIRTEHTHQVILHTYKEHTATWVTLTSSTTTQLTIHTAALMALSTQDSQTTCFFHLSGKLNIGTTTSHVGGDGYHTFATCFSDNICLTLVQLSVEHVVRDLAQVEHLTQQLTDFHRSGTHQYWATCFDQFYNFVNHGIVFLALGAIDTVVHILASDRTVSRDNHYIQFVDIPKLACLCLRCTSHT